LAAMRTLKPPLALGGLGRRERAVFFEFSEKMPEPRQLDDVVRRQDRADKIRLRRGVNFIQMMLRFGLKHKLLDAFVEGAFNDHIGTRAARGANALLVD